MAEASDIRPIETHYNGYRFRSRLEARWGVFFDAMQRRDRIRLWHYEHEGFRLPSGPYLPDFYFPVLKCFAEVKPLEDLPIEHFEFSFTDSYPVRDDDLPREIILGVELIQSVGHDDVAYFVCVYGDPLDAITGRGDGGAVSYCRRHGLRANAGFIDFWVDGVNTAAFKARSARFEHGERG